MKKNSNIYVGKIRVFDSAQYGQNCINLGFLYFTRLELRFSAFLTLSSSPGTNKENHYSCINFLNYFFSL